jgi:hypothetical protein
MARFRQKYQSFTGLGELARISALARVDHYRDLRAALLSEQPDNIAAKGYKVYSQTDEDGIIEEIFSRTGADRTFIEIGIESGHECNSHLLLLKEWRGCWIEGSPKWCARVRAELGLEEAGNIFQLIEAFVRRDNISSLYRRACAFLEVENVGLFSLDIDGNDFFIAQELLSSGARPHVLCLEYNGHFPPPLAFSIEYSENHAWNQTDYFGATLQAFVDMLEPKGYRLITCNLAGLNAFFVREELAGHFPRRSAADLFQPLRVHLSPLPTGHEASLRFVRDRLERIAGK